MHGIIKCQHQGQMSESFPTAAFLSISGGLQDAYTYVFRGKVFANAQTGNIVLLSQNICERNWLQSAHYFVPVGSICNRHHCCRADTGKISECAEYPLEADCPATGNDSAVFGKLSSCKVLICWLMHWYLFPALCRCRHSER